MLRNFSLYIFHRVEPETTSQEEPKFIVFYSTLLSIFSLFCFKCKEGTPQVSMKSSGTMVTVIQHCSNCLQDFTWQSQPLLRSKYPAGNILLSLSILLAGASISKIQLVFRHMGLVTYNVRTFFRHQKFILFPSIIHHWENYQNALISQLQHVEENVWCGDGRFDSMGHSAKYGIYTMFSSSLNKICHFEIVQVSLYRFDIFLFLSFCIFKYNLYVSDMYMCAESIIHMYIGIISNLCKL